MTRRSRHLVVLIVYSALLLSIGITREWRLVHEDNGAMQVALALSHTRQGLGETKAHNWFVTKDGKGRLGYPHHPAGVPLLIAGGFAVTGSESRAVARAVMIVFSIGSVVLMYGILRKLFEDETIAFAGALFFATIPMQSFFGRMVNFEPPVLFFILLTLTAWLWRSWPAMAAAIVAGVLIDWTILFFCAAIIVAELVEWVRKRATPHLMMAAAAAAAVGLALAFAHIAFAFGSLQRFFDVLGKDVGAGHEPLRLLNWLSLMFENYRHYFTTTGVLTSIVIAGVTILPRARMRPEIRRFALVAGGAALVYLLASPNRARLHHYWQFFFLPYAATAFALVLTWLRARKANAVIALIILEVLAATGYKLYRRHTEPGEYAVTAIEHYESLYLAPR
jgi:hypothetical protein